MRGHSKNGEIRSTRTATTTSEELHTHCHAPQRLIVLAAIFCCNIFGTMGNLLALARPLFAVFDAKNKASACGRTAGQVGGRRAEGFCRTRIEQRKERKHAIENQTQERERDKESFRPGFLGSLRIDANHPPRKKARLAPSLGPPPVPRAEHPRPHTPRLSRATPGEPVAAKPTRLRPVFRTGGEESLFPRSTGRGPSWCCWCRRCWDANETRKQEILREMEAGA